MVSRKIAYKRSSYATVFPDEKEGLDEDELIANIREAIKANHERIKVWNLSISITRPVCDNKFSDHAIALDDLQTKYNILICKSAGNCSNFMSGRPKGRIHEGADSVRSLVVGSVAQAKGPDDFAEVDNPSPFSRIGPGPEYIIKAKAYLHEKDLVDYKGETLKVIRGQSKLSIELLNSLIAEVNDQIRDARANADTAEKHYSELLESAENLRKEYDRLLTWVDLYDKSTFEAKKMIAAQFIKAVRVGRDYNIEIDFNVSFDEFQSFCNAESADENLAPLRSHIA